MVAQIVTKWLPEITDSSTAWHVERMLSHYAKHVVMVSLWVFKMYQNGDLKSEILVLLGVLNICLQTCAEFCIQNVKQCISWRG